ncbi:hypothetical protein D3C75_570260 [compost metagenome]
MVKQCLEPIGITNDTPGVEQQQVLASRLTRCKIMNGCLIGRLLKRDHSQHRFAHLRHRQQPLLHGCVGVALVEDQNFITGVVGLFKQTFNATLQTRQISTSLDNDRDQRLVVVPIFHVIKQWQLVGTNTMLHPQALKVRRHQQGATSNHLRL